MSKSDKEKMNDAMLILVFIIASLVLYHWYSSKTFQNKPCSEICPIPTQ